MLERPKDKGTGYRAQAFEKRFPASSHAVMADIFISIYRQL